MRGERPNTVARRSAHVSMLRVAQEQVLDLGLRARVKRHRVPRARLGQPEALAVAVHRADRRVDVAAHARLDGRDRRGASPRRRSRVRVSSGSSSHDGSFEMPERSTTVSTPFEMLRSKRADVAPDDVQLLGEARSRGREGVAEVEAIEHGHFVTPLQQEGDQDRADVAGTTGDEDVHRGRRLARNGAEALERGSGARRGSGGARSREVGARSRVGRGRRALVEARSREGGPLPREVEPRNRDGGPVPREIRASKSRRRPRPEVRAHLVPPK